MLGAILLGQSFDSVSEVLSAEDFYLTRHQNIFTAMRQLWAQNVTIDVLTVCAELDRMGHLEGVGGRGVVADLVVDVVSGARIMAHAKIVRELAVLRSLQRIGLQLQLDAEARKGSSEVGREVEEKLFAALWERQVATWQRGDQVIIQALDEIERLTKTPGGRFGMTTGLTEVDRILCGLQRSDLVIVAGRTSMGKTSFALGMAIAAAKSGHRVGVVTLEMSKEQLARRMLSYESGVSTYWINRGELSPNQVSRINWAGVNLGGFPIAYLDMNPLTLDRFRAAVRREKIQNGIDLIILDYLQLIHNPNRKDSRQAEIAEISRGLKLIAKELNVCIVALSQVSRKAEERDDKRPTLADLRESGAIEQDADVVLMLYRDEWYDPDSPDKGIAEVLIRKHRNGPTGEVRVAFLEECAKFSNLQPVAG